MSQITFTEFVETTAKQFNIPGVAAGVWADGKEVYACSGVTSVDNPLPIDQDTLFVVASITKPFTATTLMRLVAEGKVELAAPVRRYVPEFRLKDEQAADQITVLHLLNHTAGLDWRVSASTGEGDDALRRRKLIAWLPWQDLDHEPADVESADPQETIGTTELVRGALKRMPAQYRAALLLYTQEGFSYAEIASTLNIAESGVKMYLSRARHSFREHYRALEQGGGVTK